MLINLCLHMFHIDVAPIVYFTLLFANISSRFFKIDTLEGVAQSAGDQAS